MTTQVNNLSILTNVLTDPQKAFKDIQADYPILLPLLSFLSLAAFVSILYLYMVDYSWYVEQNVEMLAGDKSKSEQETVRTQMNLMAPTTQGVIAAITTTIGYLIFFAVYAGYYVMCSNINNDGYDFKQWFSFISWAWIPKSLLLLIAVVIILISDNGQISQYSLNPVSLNSLIFDLNPTTGLGMLASMIDLATFWTIGIMVIGYKQWTQSSLGKSLFIVLLPYLLIFGIWALIAA